MLNTGKLANKTLYITGASRGIGKAIALKAARDGANVVIAAKTAEPHPKLPGTIYTAAQEIENAGGVALPCIVDIRSEEQVSASIEAAVRKFGGIDILVNNASAISLTGTLQTSMKKYDLMHSINSRGTYLVSKLVLPYLLASKNNPHILNISPPLNMSPRWFANHVAYTSAKYGMSLCVLGMAAEFKEKNIGVNALWPKTAIITAAMEMMGGKDIASQCRKPEIMADAAYVMLTRDSKSFTGNFSIDETILREEGVTDFESYAVQSGASLIPDFFLDEFDTVDLGRKPPSSSNLLDLFTTINSKLSSDLVQKSQAVYYFNISGEDWFLDLKNGNGSAGSGKPSAPDATFIMEHTKDFTSMISGKLNPQAAFMSGKLKLEGNMSKALHLEKVLPNLRSFHTSCKSLSSPIPPYEEIPQIFDRIKEVASEEIVKKVDAIYLFEVDGHHKYFVDLKSGRGNVGTGDIAGADVTIKMTSANLLKMFNRELKPATAFMTGKLKLSGDLSKAMALEAVMKASRGEASFHTSAVSRLTFSSVSEVFERIGKIASVEIVSKVNAIYQFDVEGESKYFIDFKNGSGSVGSGDVPTGKADVTIKMNSENFIKMFNRELAPASAFMTGKIKVTGDLSKALTLEAVMKAVAAESAKK